MNSTLHLQYHDWDALEQGTEPPIAPRVLEQWLPSAPDVCSQCVCSLLTAVCVHLDGLNAEHQFRVWVTILDNTSHYYYFYIISTCPSCLCVSQFAVVQIWTASCAAVMLCEDSSAGPGAGPDSVVLVKPIAETSTDPVQEVIHSSTYVSSVIPAHGGFRWVKVRVPQTLMSFNVWCFWKTSFVLIKAAFIW